MIGTGTCVLMLIICHMRCVSRKDRIWHLTLSFCIFLFFVPPGWSLLISLLSSGVTRTGRAHWKCLHWVEWRSHYVPVETAQVCVHEDRRIYGKRTMLCMPGTVLLSFLVLFPPFFGDFKFFSISKEKYLDQALFKQNLYDVFRKNITMGMILERWIVGMNSITSALNNGLNTRTCAPYVKRQDWLHDERGKGVQAFTIHHSFI